MSDNVTGRPQRRLRHRIPTTLRRHWKVLAALVAFVVFVGTAFGSTRVRPYITGDATVIASEITENIAGTVDLFDTSVGHEMSVEISDVEYDDMIAAYQDNGEKEWVNATVTIDGTVITDVAVRLKGNSTLTGLRANGDGGGIRPPEGIEPPEGVALPEDSAPEGTIEPFGGGPGAGMGGPDGTASLSADDPASLPLLISFDKIVSGRAYQGMTEISVRPGTPVLNEAMALSLTADTGQPTQRYTYSTYSVNDSATTTRLLLEHPDDGYANSLFDSDGYLYKADASSRFEYIGDDQADYTEQFEQINAEGTGDVQPIISFLKWLDSASDEEFDAHLADRVDVDSFAKYLATQNLLVNSDDMSGPGQNYYLWYDLDTKKLSVVSWDLNLAMQGSTDAGPHDSVSMGGMMDGPGRVATTGDGGLPAGAPVPEGMMPPGADGRPEAAAPAGRGPGGDFGAGNSLATRFLASDAFTDLYESTYWDLYEQIYGSGRALEVLDEVVASVPVSDGLTAGTLQENTDSLRTWIRQRTDALAAQQQ